MIKLLGLMITFTSFVCAAAETDGAFDAELGRIHVLLGRAQAALDDAQRVQAKNGAGSAETVMILAASATRNVPEMLETLPFLGIVNANLGRCPLKDPNLGVIRWFTQLNTGRDRLFDRGVFDITRVTNGISKAGDFITGLDINPLHFATKTYNLVRMILERNPNDAKAQDLAFQYFNKLDEQDWQCCAGFVGRIFHAFTMAYIYLIDQHEERARAAAQLAAAAEQSVDDAQAAAAVSPVADAATRGDALLAAQMQLVERERMHNQRLAEQRAGMFAAEEALRQEIVDEWVNSSPKVQIHPGRGAISALFLSLQITARYGADGRTANRLFTEEGVVRETERVAAERIRLAEQAAAVAAEETLVSSIKDAFALAEKTIFGSLAGSLNNCVEKVMKDHRRNDPLLAFNLLAAQRPDLQQHIDLLKRAHLIRKEPSTNWWGGAAISDYLTDSVSDRKRGEYVRAREAYVLRRLVEGAYMIGA